MEKKNGYSFWTMVVVVAMAVLVGGIIFALSNQNEITDDRDVVPGIGGGPETSPSPTDSPSPTPDESPMIFPDSDPPAFR